MASKSKKRRRVFRASCILAALIIAGSSFAWFTSSDEVTNRLSAQADYGVSIVESFSPTNKWLPGQQVNKDVYATNTGNTEALVKEEIDTRIAITYEVDQAKWDEDCVQLTEEERYGIEAGSFLAYKPSDSTRKTGDTIVVRPKDQTVPATEEFTPDTKGLYVFRRAIDVKAADQSETFTYDAYYFVPAVAAQAAQGTEGQDGYVPAVEAQPEKYYKVSNLQVYQDSHVAESTTTPGANEGDPAVTTWTFKDYMGDGVYDDGTLMVASGSFRKEITDYVDPMDLTYLKLSDTIVAQEPTQEAPNEYYKMDAGQYLVATYDRGNNTAMADATAKAEALDKAIHEFEYADQLYTKALAEYNNAKTGNEAGNGTGGSDKAKTDLDNAKSALETKASEYQAALTEYNNAVTAYNNAYDAVVAAKNAYDNSMTKLYGSPKGNEDPVEEDTTFSPTETITDSGYTADSLYGKYMKAKDAREKAHIGNEYTYTSAGENKGIVDEYTNYKNDSGVTGLPEEYTGLTTTQLKAFRDWVDEHTDAEEHDHWMLVIDELIAKTNYNNEKAKCLGDGSDYTDADEGTYGDQYNTTLGTYQTAYNTLGDPSKNTEAAAVGATTKETFGANEGETNQLAAAKNALESAQTNYNSKLSAYTSALEATEKAEELKDIAEALKEAATQVQTAAQEAYNAASAAAKLSESDGKVKIYIKLNDDAVITDQTGATNDKWFLDPVDLGAAGDVQTGTLLNNKAVFYYTGLLEGGETSTKLVDYVYLDDDIKANDYKNFDFDINVALKSAQVNFDENGNYKTDAAQAEIGKFATLADNTDVDTVVTWSDSLT